jgi:hypothetical protein
MKIHFYLIYFVFLFGCKDVQKNNLSSMSFKSLKKSNVIYAFDSSFRNRKSYIQEHSFEKKNFKERSGNLKIRIKYTLLKKEKDNDGRMKIKIQLYDSINKYLNYGDYDIIFTWKYNQQTGELYDVTPKITINNAAQGFLKITYACLFGYDENFLKDNLFARQTFYFQYEYNFNDNKSLQQFKDRGFSLEFYKDKRKGFYFENFFDISFWENLYIYSAPRSQ